MDEEIMQNKIETPALSENVEDEREAVEKRYLLMAEQRHSEFSGPLPPPEVLAKYENAFPGAAKKIFQMAEDQAQHRRSMEKESLQLASRDSLFGIITGFVIAIVGIVGGIYIVYLNPSSAANAIAGSAVSGSSLLGLVRTFVVGSKKQNEKQNKADNNDQE